MKRCNASACRAHIPAHSAKCPKCGRYRWRGGDIWLTKIPQSKRMSLSALTIINQCVRGFRLSNTRDIFRFTKGEPLLIKKGLSAGEATEITARFEELGATCAYRKGKTHTAT